MQFSYAAKSLSGESIRGVIDADTDLAARQMLREKGLFPLSLAPARTVLAMAAASRKLPVNWSRRKVSKSELMLLTSQFVIMCRSGVDLAESLQNVAASCKNPRLKTALQDVYGDVAAGMSFSSAMRKQSHVFGESYVASVAAGEASGTVPNVLERLADLLGKEIKLRTAVIAALSYPMILLGVCLVVVAALLLFVLPNFERVFADMEITPPITTQFLLMVSAELRSRLWLWAGVTAIAAFLGWQLLWTSQTRRMLDHILLRTKPVGDVFQALTSGRLFVLLGTMLQSGVPLIESLQLCRTAMRNLCYRELIDVLQEEVLNGRSIGKVLANSPVIPAGAAQMVGTAEQAGKLGIVMQLVGDYYEDEGQRKIQELAKLLEPLIIIVMGIVVAFVVASIMLPILDISTSGAS